MSYEPLVSVVINNYNYGRFLRECIESALGQTYLHTEIIVVDDGSTDESREIIASYGDRIISVFKENGGQASALNAGFLSSSGEIICFLDSDDVWLPPKVERVVHTSSTAREAALIYHAYQRTNSDLMPFGRVLPLSFLSGDASERVYRSGGCWPFPPTSALAFPRSVLSSVMPIPEAPFRTCADACLAYALPLVGPIASIKEPLCLYRIHGSNLYTKLPATNRDVRGDLARVERYRLCVEGANQLLARIGRRESFALENHVAYLRTQYVAGVPNHPSWAEVSWKLARMASEPSWFVRSKLVAKFWLESLGFGRFS